MKSILQTWRIVNICSVDITAVGFSIDKQLLGRKTSQIGDISIAFSIP